MVMHRYDSCNLKDQTQAASTCTNDLVIHFLMPSIWCVSGIFLFICCHDAHHVDVSHPTLMEEQEAGKQIRIWHLLNGRAS